MAFGEDVFRIAGGLRSPTDFEASVTAAYDRSTKKKKVTLDGQVASSLTSALGRLGAVVFSPADIAMVDGAPAERRRYLNILLSLNKPGYVDRLQEYRQALTQRNAALKAHAPADLVAPWSEALLRAGTDVIEGRQGWVAEVADEFATTYRKVSGGEGARLFYRSSGSRGGGHAPEELRSRDQIESDFRESLEAAYTRDERTCTTSVGPHRDELRVAFGDGTAAENQEVRTYGSGGQRRTAALALRLVEASTVRRSRGHAPLVLLDDAFAELDEARSGRLLELIDDGGIGQVVLTAPKESDVRVRADVLPRWHIAHGRIEA